MTYAHIDAVRPDVFGLKARYQQLRAMLGQRAARRAAYNRTLNELQALSDRDLADFGVHRSEIPRLAREAAETV